MSTGELELTGSFYLSLKRLIIVRVNSESMMPLVSSTKTIEDTLLVLCVASACLCNLWEGEFGWMITAY